jgi:SAM-dependent methyltransferase
MAARAGDFDYEAKGAGYASHRQPDPTIAALIKDALGTAHTVLNVGAGAGSYEPMDRDVVALEPSVTMRAQRPPHLSEAMDGIAEELPFANDSFEAAMATVTIHQWTDPEKGLREMRRVSTGPVVILTFDGDALDTFWLAHYAPSLIDAERRRYPKLSAIAEALGGDVTIIEVPIPRDCPDGFTEAFYARPEAFLRDEVRRAQSAWSFVSDSEQRECVNSLRSDLASGEWDRVNGWLRNEPFFIGSLRLIVAVP